MSVNEFMADFMIAAADYYRMNDAVHDYLEACNGQDSVAKNVSIREILDNIAKCTESIANAKKSVGSIQLCDLNDQQVYDDVAAAYGMVALWDGRVSLLNSMMRSIALETDADCIELLARSRNNANANINSRTERTLDIADPDGIELFSDEEDESEVYSEEEDYTDEESDGATLDGTEEDDAESEEGAEVIDGWMPNDIPMNGPVVEVPSVDDDGAEIFIAKTAETDPEGESAQIVEAVHDDGSDIITQTAVGMVDDVPVEKPLTREDIQSIVLETMKEFFAQTAPVVAQEKSKPKKTTRRKSTAVKSTISKIRRKKDEEEPKDEEETEVESPEVEE